MKKLFITILLCLYPLTLQATQTEVGIGIQYNEPTLSQCGPSTQLKPTHAPTMCVEALGNKTLQNACDASKNQRFEMVPMGTAGLFQLQSTMTLKCLRMGANPGDHIIETSCGAGSQDQVFRIGASPSLIQSNVGAGGLCLDVRQALTTPGTELMSFGCNGQFANQLFAYSLSPGNDCLLGDLKGTKIYMDVIKDGVGGTVTTINASAKTGGGLIKKDLCVPLLDLPTVDRVEFEVTAFDFSGNESVRTPKVSVQVQGRRDCSPLPPPDTTAPLGVQNLSLN